MKWPALILRAFRWCRQEKRALNSMFKGQHGLRVASEVSDVAVSESDLLANQGLNPGEQGNGKHAIQMPQVGGVFKVNDRSTWQVFDFNVLNVSHCQPPFVQRLNSISQAWSFGK